MKRLILLLAVVPSLAARPQVEERQDVTGIVLQMQRTQHRMTVSCDGIPGQMEPMKMSFVVRDWDTLRAVHTGTPIHFLMARHGQTLYATAIEPRSAANLESEPMQAAGLAALQTALDPGRAVRVLRQGDRVPAFELTDQAGHTVQLSDLAGKVVLLTFGYSRCPNPDYCFRLSNNLAQVRSHLSARSRRDLVLITIAIDPQHDRGETLRQYAMVWKADPAYWHFLTGPLPEIKSVAALFGEDFWGSEGFLTHSLHTVILDRRGDLVANLEGNSFSVQQLADLVQTTINQSKMP